MEISYYVECDKNEAKPTSRNLEESCLPITKTNNTNNKDPKLPAT